MMSISLSLVDVQKTFRSIRNEAVEAIRDISLEVKEGEFLTIIGPSGCGKTTILRMIAGLESPSSGEIFLKGQSIQGINPKIGFVFQEFVLLPWRTVLGNIEFGLEVRGVNKEERRRQAMDHIKFVELEGFENKYPKELSGGMKQRVAISRTVICDPSIFLMDEPFAALDAQTRYGMQRFLMRIWEKTGKTIVFVTHNVDEAVFLGQRLIIMSSRPGRIISEATIDLEYPRDINSPEFIDIRRKALDLLENAKGDSLGDVSVSVDRIQELRR
jgi:NitT/TauT family transport system ATP-binding protein